MQPVCEAVGQRTMWVGEARAGTRLKLATNSWVLTVVEGVAGTLALAEGLELDPQLVLEPVSGDPLDLPYLRMKGKAIIERSFDPPSASRSRRRTPGCLRSPRSAGTSICRCSARSAAGWTRARPVTATRT